MNMIKTQNISKKYNKFTALDNVSLTLDKGDIYGLIGKNGAGKTTLFKVIMNLTKPTSGSYEILGVKNATDIYNNIGFMMNNGFYGYLNAEQNLEYFRRIKGITDKNEVIRVLKLVELFGVKKKFKEYSMGMKQRLGIANALMGNPSIVILDEPINGLDPQGIADFRNIILDINIKHNTTFIISSHILGELSLMANKFGFINNGSLIEEISKEELGLKTKNAFSIRVDNNNKACVLLETRFGINNYIIDKNNEIVIFDNFDQVSDVIKVLVENDINVKSSYLKETSLEDYFFNLIGGKENV